jgi:O-antigen/teichoic acid export membrane protein
MKRNYIWMLSSKIALMVAALVTASLINRALGPELRGVLAEIQTWVALMVTCFGLSLDTAIYHFSNRELYPGKDSNQLATVIVMTLVYSSVASLFILSVTHFKADIISSTTMKYVFLMVILLVSTMFSSNLAVFYQARGRMVLSSVAGFLQALINVSLIGIAYYFSNLNLRLIVICLIVVQVTGLLVFLIMGTRGQFLKGIFSLSLARDMLGAGLKQHAATVSTFVYTRINQLILLKYCGEAQAGLFAVSLSLIMAAIVIPSTLQIVLYPRVIQATDDFEITILTLRAGFYGWGFIVVALFLLAKPIIYIYGGTEFMNSVTSFRILLLTAWLLPISSFIAPYVIKKGAFLLSSASAVFVGVISVILNYILIPRFLSSGAAWATVISSTVGFFIAVFLLALVAQRNPLKFLRIWGVNNG